MGVGSILAIIELRFNLFINLHIHRLINNLVPCLISYERKHVKCHHVQHIPHPGK